MQQLLELSGQRTIAIQDRGRPYSFTIRQITERDWLKYFDGIDSRSKRVGKDQRNTNDIETAMLKLLDEVLIGATGYALPAGVDELVKVQNWKQAIPLRHRMQLGRVLRDIEVIEDPLDELPVLGIDRVVLRATWGSDEKGRLVSYSPLVHSFSTPSFEHMRRYKRDQSQTVIVGGSRSGETIYTGWQRTLIKLYDELSAEVTGYSIHGVALASAAEAQTHMDAYHKVVAMEQVFQAPQAAEEVEESHEEVD